MPDRPAHAGAGDFENRDVGLPVQADHLGRDQFSTRLETGARPSALVGEERQKYLYAAHLADDVRVSDDIAAGIHQHTRTGSALGAEDGCAIASGGEPGGDHLHHRRVNPFNERLIEPAEIPQLGIAEAGESQNEQ